MGLAAVDMVTGADCGEVLTEFEPLKMRVNPRDRRTTCYGQRQAGGDDGFDHLDNAGQGRDRVTSMLVGRTGLLDCVGIRRPSEAFFEMLVQGAIVSFADRMHPVLKMHLEIVCLISGSYHLKDRPLRVSDRAVKVEYDGGKNHPVIMTSIKVKSEPEVSMGRIVEPLIHFHLQPPQTTPRVLGDEPLKKLPFKPTILHGPVDPDVRDISDIGGRQFVWVRQGQHRERGRCRSRPRCGSRPDR